MSSGRLSLRTLVFVGGATLMLLPALAAGWVYTGALQQRAEQVLADGMRVRGELSANILARRLHELWSDVSVLARSVSEVSGAEARRPVEMVSRFDARFSWLGFADVEGRVVAAKNGLLEGISVAERAWFRRGLAGPAAVDVHEAQLLARLLPAPPNGEPLRFIDFAAPVRSGNDVVGVIGAHLDWRWVIDNLKALESPGIEVLLISRDRTVLYGPAELLNRPLAVSSAQAANRVTAAVLDERWPDGRDYVTVVVPTIGHSDLPSFGWTLLVRQSMDQALGPTRELIRSFWLLLGSGAAVALVLLWLAAAWVTTPLRRLARSAEALVANAEAEAPAEETRYDEAARLRNALVRLQSRLLSAMAPARPAERQLTAVPTHDLDWEDPAPSQQRTG